MDRKTFIQHLKVGIVQYYDKQDVAVTFKDIDDLCEYVTNEIDHSMYSIESGFDGAQAS